MWFVRMASTAIAALFERSRVARVATITATVLATTVAVLLVAFVAVVVGLT